MKISEKAIEEIKNGVRLRVHVQPKASKTEIVGMHGDAIKLRIKAPPVDGKANDEVMGFLAKILGVSKTQITLLSGHKGRQKSILIYGLSKLQICQKLKEL